MLTLQLYLNEMFAVGTQNLLEFLGFFQELSHRTRRVVHTALCLLQGLPGGREGGGGGRGGGRGEGTEAGINYKTAT